MLTAGYRFYLDEVVTWSTEYVTCVMPCKEGLLFRSWWNVCSVLCGHYYGGMAEFVVADGLQSLIHLVE
jgi:hypothetical protein